MDTQPNIITTAQELPAVPFNTIVEDKNGGIATRVLGGWSYDTNPEVVLSRYTMVDRLPLKVLGTTEEFETADTARAAQRRQDRIEAALNAKLDAVVAYRASIVGTVPAHRLDTRQSGFLDGWDAALAWVAQQRTAEEGR